MGLSIHYKGNISNYSLIDTLTEEVKDVAADLDWQYHLFDDKDLKGICFSPKDCEPVFLTFQPNGKLCSPVNLKYWEPNDPYFNTISTKTQFAGIDVHIALLKLLDYLRRKYFENFEMNDEGQYWDVWDEQILQQQFARYNYAMNAVAAALQDFKAIPGETALSLAERLEAWLNDKLDK
jgi:hypothetical protein